MSISGAVGIAALIAWGLGGVAAWPVGAFGAAVSYLAPSGTEVALARRAQLVAGTENLDER